jgi:hypothetical protein
VLQHGCDQAATRSVPVPPLPVDRFAAFQAFAEAAPAVTPPTAMRSWRFADAVQVAADIAYAVGVFGVVAGDPESDALAWWLSIFGSEEWRDKSRQAMRHVADHAASYNPMQSPLLPLEPIAVARLNAWAGEMLTAFYANTAANRLPELYDAEALPTAEAAPATSTESADTPTKPPLRETVDGKYRARVDDFRHRLERPPTRAEDEVWRKGQGISRDRRDALRRQYLTAEEKRGGAPKKPRPRN